MTIRLPADIERSIHTEVASGHFASADEALALAWRVFQRQRALSNEAPAGPGEVGQAERPFWEVIEEENRSIPSDVWDALPTDLAAQHDHYIHGTPKRSDA